MAQGVIVDVDDEIMLEIDPSSRSHKLREIYWNRSHNAGLVHKEILGSNDNSLTGHAKDFSALLEASTVFILPDELIVGCHLALPNKGNINLGYYNSHYPPGHERILNMGLVGIRDYASERLNEETDPEKMDFLRAVEISYDSTCRYVQKYADYIAEMSLLETNPRRKDELKKISDVCHELAVNRPTSFHSALQLFWFIHIFGGRGCIGRFDQWMYPFYKNDVDEGKITRNEAQELLECLWIKLNYFAGNNDSLRNIALAGQTPDGEDATNELTYMCLEASAKLMLPEPKLNVHFFNGSPKRLLRECCRVIAKGMNVLAVFNDEVIIPALSRLGIPIEDARDYCNDGCSELIIGGKGTISFRVHDSLTLLRETVMQAEEHNYETFDDVMSDFKSRLNQFMHEGNGQDDSITFPFFAASIKDCLEKSSPKGARYSIWGEIMAEMGNTADGLSAIKKFIYDDKTLTWEKLVSALKSDYNDDEPLRQMLLNRTPKYGNDKDEVDLILKDIAEYFCDGIHERAKNPYGYGSKRAAGFMSFGIHGKSALPASPDGRKAGDLTANSFSPAVGMDRNGPTAVLNSIHKIDLTKASHGSVLDLALHTTAIRGEDGFSTLTAFVGSFLKMPCTATLQLNVIDRDTLLKARSDPKSPQYKTLIVRVWGFSAVFVELDPALQEHVLLRTEHVF
jgi:formate C-acetyltransferase